jgi:inhibitor of cysteine peptidase
MRRIFSLLFVLALLSAEARADDALKMKVGGRASIKLGENASTGYSWRIDPAQSSNLDILRIEDGGFLRGGGNAPMPGAPGVHKWSVQALAPGQAMIDFVYQRPWENEPARAHRVNVQVKPR